jgi:ABC-type amino acid transport substrate-binding protein
MQRPDHVGGTNRWPRWLAQAVLWGACSVVQAGPTLERIKATGKITLAYQPGPPFAYTADQSKPIGYAIDLCQRISEAVRQALNMKALEVVYLPVTSADRLPALMEKRADMECGSTTNNEKRRQSVAFTVPHFITGTRFAVRGDSGILKARSWFQPRAVRLWRRYKRPTRTVCWASISGQWTLWTRPCPWLNAEMLTVSPWTMCCCMP